MFHETAPDAPDLNSMYSRRWPSWIAMHDGTGTGRLGCASEFSAVQDGWHLLVVYIFISRQCAFCKESSCLCLGVRSECVRGRESPCCHLFSGPFSAMFRRDVPWKCERPSNYPSPAMFMCVLLLWQLWWFSRVIVVKCQGEVDFYSNSLNSPSKTCPSFSSRKQ